MLLSLCMIAKNEQHCIGRAIESLKNVVDEIIVADTGSSDNTAKIARSMGAKVFSYPWTDDFSAARNFSISQAKGEWIIFIDADEVIAPADAEKIPMICAQAGALLAFMVTQRNYTGDSRKQNFTLCDGSYGRYESAKGYVPVNRIGIFRNIPEIRFSGIIHETVGASLKSLNATVGTTDIAVHHYGHLNHANSKSKSQFYLALGLKQIELTPDQAKPYYETGLIYLEDGNFIEAEKYLLKCASINPDYEDVMFNLGILYFKWHKFDQALAYLELTEQKQKKITESITVRAIIHDFSGNPAQGIDILERGIIAYPADTGMKPVLAGLYLKTGGFAEAGLLYDDLLKSDPSNADFVIGSVAAKYQCADYIAALDTAENYIKTGVFNPHLTVWCLKIYERLAMWNEFEEKLKEIQKQGLSEGEICYLRGILEEGKGNIKMALSFYKEGLVKSPHLAQEINLRLQKFKQLL